MNSKIIKNFIIRARFNQKDPNDYLYFFKKKFNKIKIESLNKTAFERLSKQILK